MFRNILTLFGVIIFASAILISADGQWPEINKPESAFLAG